MLQRIAMPVSAPPSPSKSTAKNDAKGQRRPPLPITWTPPEGLDRHAWILQGRHLGSLSRKSNWWVGDWLRYGTATWGEKYVVAAKITGYDTHSLENMVYVASRVGISLRRENLSWSHHSLVAALEPKEQTYWLDRATECNFSVNDLRIELKADRRLKATSDELDERSGASDAVVCPQCGFRISAHESQTAATTKTSAQRQLGC
jgi:ssDNA-binding Zn-finger/Zn-ribbon topoisomerase 1